MNIGFTGTRDGTTASQRLSMIRWLHAHRNLNDFHHGCCIGADAQAVRLVMFPHVRGIVGHPPDNDAMLSKSAVANSDRLMPPRPYLARNRNIVDAGDILLACPDGPERQRSGTWSTVRYARRSGKPVVIFWPNGSVTEEGAAS